MVSALVNGVKGGKWFSLIDKVDRPSTLGAAWRCVARNRARRGIALLTRFTLTPRTCAKDIDVNSQPF